MNSLGDIYNEFGVTKESTIEQINKKFAEMANFDKIWFSAYYEILLDPIKRSLYDEIDDLAESLWKEKKRKRYFESIVESEIQFTPWNRENELSSVIYKTISSMEKNDSIGKASCLLLKRFLYLLVDVDHQLTSDSLAKDIILCSLRIANMKPPEITETAFDINIFWDCKKLSLLVMHLNLKRVYYTLDIVAACKHIIEEEAGNDMDRMPNDVKVAADILRKLVFCLIPEIRPFSYDFRLSIMREAVFPSMGYTNEEIRLYEKDPTEYAQMKLDEAFRYKDFIVGRTVEYIFRFKFKRAIHRWIYYRKHLTAIIEFCLDILGRPTEGNEIDKEKALHLIAIALDHHRFGHCKANTDRIRNMYNKLIGYLRDLVRAQATFLRARACSMLSCPAIIRHDVTTIFELKKAVFRTLDNEPELFVRLEKLMTVLPHFLELGLDLQLYPHLRQPFLEALFEITQPFKGYSAWFLLQVALEKVMHYMNKSRATPLFEYVATKIEPLIEELIEVLKSVQNDEQEIEKTTSELKILFDIWSYVWYRGKLDSRRNCNRFRKIVRLILELAQSPQEKRKILRLHRLQTESIPSDYVLELFPSTWNSLEVSQKSDIFHFMNIVENSTNDHQSAKRLRV